jgi:hypothetical protein
MLASAATAKGSRAPLAVQGTATVAKGEATPTLESGDPP